MGPVPHPYLIRTSSGPQLAQPGVLTCPPPSSHSAADPGGLASTGATKLGHEILTPMQPKVAAGRTYTNWLR